MNFVHFPKLNDYALEPELIKEPAEYGQEVVKTSACRPALSPGASHSDDGRTKRRSLKDKYTRDDQVVVQPDGDTTQATAANSNVCPSNHCGELDQRGDDSNDTQGETNDGDKTLGHRNFRARFFRRYDDIRLPHEGLDLSDPTDDKSKHIKSSQVMTSPTDAGIPATTGSVDRHGPSRLTVPVVPGERPASRGDELWSDQEHQRGPRATHPDLLIHISTNTTASSALKGTTLKSNKSKSRSYLHKFKRITQAVVNVLKLAKVIIKRTDSPSALLKTFTALSREPEKEEESENMKNYGLQFDLSYFRANKEITISSEVKHILRLPPSHRTPEQIQTAMFGLQSLPSFAEYPLHMQEKLTKVAWHEIVTPQRTIIRQGHFAENFYFILSGQAVVTIHKPGEASAQTAAIMRKGTSFGELALLHHSRRTATVTSHDTVQLLSVGREDFFDIFMSGQRTGEIPEHIQFISQLDFMKDWPLERLLERADQCLLHFFKRGTVIVRDSKVSEWIYVVKSGSCQVLKQLKRVKACLGAPKGGFLGARGSRARTAAFHPEPTRTEGRHHHRKPQSRGITQNAPTDGNKNLGNHAKDKEPPQLPVFVQIELLKPKDVFGLDLINSNMHSSPTSVSLVSLGAECVMLSKAFFIKHASDSLRKRFAEIIQPYPDEESLQDSLQTKVNWELYKRSLILQVAAHKQPGVR